LAEATAESKHLDDDFKGLLDHDRAQIEGRRRLRDHLRARREARIPLLTPRR
jgi:hypothetical protein